MDAMKPEEVRPDEFEIEEMLRDGVRQDVEFRRKILVLPLLFHITIHMCGLYGFYLMVFRAMWQTIFWGFFLGFTNGWGVICGTHRGFSHKSFKAAPLLKAILLLWHVQAGQNSTYTWARDHRLHHKYSDTDADPHNSNRGFVFSHVGWLVTNKHPLVKEKGRMIDVSDLKADKLIMFQHNYFVPLYVVFGVMIPILVPYYLWGESFGVCFFVPYCFRYVTLLNITWCVNSFAHAWGSKPYDKRIRGVQSKFVWIITMGDGWHNYHHCFPWDYRSSEFGNQGGLSTNFIDFAHWLGLAHDLRIATPEMVQGHAKRHGDGTHFMISGKADDVAGVGKIWRSGLGIVNVDSAKSN